MDPLMSPISLGAATPSHIDEELQNFSDQHKVNDGFHSIMNLPEQKSLTDGSASSLVPLQQTPLPHSLLQPMMPVSSLIIATESPMEAHTPQVSEVTSMLMSRGPVTPMIVTPTTPIFPRLENVVATVNMSCVLDLKKIALHARNAEYNPKRFAAVIMRIREPRTTALIFSSGKMVCTGAKSEADSRLAARKYARIIQKLGFSAKFLDFKIQNMVGSVDVEFAIRLEVLYLQHRQFSSYEPELFPGLVYRMVQPRVVLLIFVSGKVVLTGAKKRQEIYDAFDNIYPILKCFRKRIER